MVSSVLLSRIARASCILAFGVFSLFAAGALCAQDGPLDPSFGDGGRVTLSLASPLSAGYAFDLVIRPDGRMVAVGGAADGNWGNYVAAQFLPDGTPDSSFGDSGLVLNPMGGGRLYGAALSEDGRLVAVGYRGFASFVARYTPDGRLDSTFGMDGFALHAFPSAWQIEARALDVALQGDGKVVVAGRQLIWETETPSFVAARLTEHGERDASFASNGYDFPDLQAVGLTRHWAHAVVVQPDERILVAGGGDAIGIPRRLVLLRYLPDGSLDPTFGDKGVAIHHIGEAHAVELLPDGRFVVAGQIGRFNSTPFVARCLPDGSLDPSFGSGGVVSHSNPPEDAALDLAVGPDGRLFVAVEYRTSTGGQFAVRAYSPDGVPDETFGHEGLVRTHFGSSDEGAHAVAVQPDGRLIAAGHGGPDDGFGLARYLTAAPVTTEGEQPEAVSTPLRAYPNPARGSARVTYATEAAGPVRLTLHDLLGRELAVLVDGERAGGAHEQAFEPSGLPAGTYLLRLQAGGRLQTTRITVAR